MVFLPDESKHTILPLGMKIIHMQNVRTPMRLLEMGLRNLYQHPAYYKKVCDYLKEDMIPKEIFDRIINGPIAACGNEFCAVPLFTESYFFLLKK